MKSARTEDIRNVALVAHSGAEKTSLGDAVLFNAKAIDRMGRVDEGTSTLDYEPDEIKRKIAISTTVAHCEWQNTKINLVDTPGYADFIGDVKSGLRVVESAIVAVCATAGVEVELKTSGSSRMREHFPGWSSLPNWIEKTLTSIRL